MDYVSEQNIIDDIKLVAKQLGTNCLSRSEYIQLGKFTMYQIYDDGKSWNSLCEKAGIQTKTKKEVTDEDYFCRLTQAVKILGRYPRASERKKFGLNMSKSRYPTLPDFIWKAVELGVVEDLFKKKGIKLVGGQAGKHSSEIADLIKIALHKNDLQDRPIPPIPLKTKRTKWGRTGLVGFPYAPQEEQGVLALFAILCTQGILPWQILDISAGKGIDVTCFDESQNKEIQVELKYLLSKGSWNHPLEQLDYVVCWENRWPNFPKPVIELSRLIKGK